MDEEQQPDLNLETVFSGLFAESASGSGEEELLRIASRYSLQLSAAQMRVLLYLNDRYLLAEENDRKKEAQRIKIFVEKWLEYRQFCGSEGFIGRALETISLRRFLNENSVKVNVEK